METVISILAYACFFLGGVALGISIGYIRLSQWYKEKTGKNLWEELQIKRK